MSSKLDKLKALSDKLEKKIEEKKPEHSMPIINRATNIRDENMKRIEEFYHRLEISEKLDDFTKIFNYKAMNLSAISLKEADFGDIREGKYVQIIAITYEADIAGKKRAKNISLGYFGKSESLDISLKNMIVEFVVRWRYEKAFLNVDHYETLLAKTAKPTGTLF